MTYSPIPANVGGIPKLQTQRGGHNFRGRLRVEAIEPVPVRIGAIRANVFFDPNTHEIMVTLMLPFRNCMHTSALDRSEVGTRLNLRRASGSARRLSD